MSKEFDEFMRTVENYPELEGTMNLCNDIISNEEQEWMNAPLGKFSKIEEISDDEIENLLRERWKLSNELINACKWYREQLKKK